LLRLAKTRAHGIQLRGERDDGAVLGARGRLRRELLQVERQGRER
jgi:hypothetical protein